MDENGIPVANEISVITSVSHSSNTNDIIDLTEINDCDECVETSCPSVIVPNNSVCPQQPQRPPRNRRRISTNSSEDSPTKAQLESKDDSICILYENVQPPSEVVFVNEVVIDGRLQNQSADIANPSISRFYPLSPNPPVVMGSFNIDPLPPLFPEISSVRTSSSYQLHNYSLDNEAPPHSSFPSCRYASVINEAPNSVSQSIGHQMSPLSTIQVPLNLKVPKIQCGICLDGPDEIAASNRNFTSTNCGHVFCNDCIKTSMKNAAKCPKCRKKITSRSIHPLFL